MKLIYVLVAIITIFSFEAIAKKPIGKIIIDGHILKDAPTTIRVKELERLGAFNFEIIDPFTANKKIKFKGVLLSKVFSTYGKKGFKSVDVFAINNYLVNIVKEEAKSEQMVLAFKQDNKPIRIDKMGPFRIVKLGKGLISSERLSFEGINWVWQVRKLVFKK